MLNRDAGAAMKRYLPPLIALGLAGLAAVSSGACGKSGNDNSNLGVSSIVFIKRQHTVTDGTGQTTVDVAGGNGQVLDYDRYVPGGSLNMLSPARPDGTLTNLTADFPQADFNGADVSFDAQQVVFSMKKDPNDHYHIYTVQLSPGGDGKYELHQKTNGDYDDINPVYLAGGRIAFVTNQMYTQMGTRADEYEHSRAATQVATISVQGGDADRHLAAQNLSHTVAPFMRHDGRLGYSRWEHLGPVNDVKLFVANPDGTQMLAIAGQHDKPANALFSIREIAPNVMIGIATTRSRTIHAGALIKIDARNQNDPACMDANADQTGHACLDEENVQYTILTPDVPTGNGPSPVGRYREPSMLPDGRILVSWADGPVNDLAEQSLTPPDFGIYVFDPANPSKNQLIYNDRSTWELNALAVVARAEPPIIGDLQHAPDGTLPGKIGSVDVTQTSLVKDTVDGAQFSNTALPDALKQAVRVRVIEGFSSEAAKGVTMFGLTMHEGAAVLGEAKVEKDGSWLASVPPYIPVHLQPIDKFGMSIRSQGLWIQANPNETRRCIGCHESRTGQGVPRYGQNPTVAEVRGPEDFFTKPILQRVQDDEYGWDTRVQPVLTAKCASCHNSTTTDYYYLTRTDPVTGAQTTYKIPYLDLSDTPVTVYYDRQVHAWPASYVSIFYPAAMDMGMGNTKVTGKVPPKWGIPGSARMSELIKKINLRAVDPADGTMAWSTPLHPEDKGITLSDDERHTIFVPMDLGGQYYARQNTAFVPFNSDPVAGTNYGK
jgi:hypothetical protein